MPDKVEKVNFGQIGPPPTSATSEPIKTSETSESFEIRL